MKTKTLYTGKQFKEYIKNTTLYIIKICTRYRNRYRNNMKKTLLDKYFELGEHTNKITSKFTQGIKIYTFDTIFKLINVKNLIDIKIAEVIISDNANIYMKTNYYVDKIRVTNVYNLKNFINLSDSHRLKYLQNRNVQPWLINLDNMSTDNLLKSIIYKPRMIYFINNYNTITYDMYLIAVKNIPNFLKNIIPEEHLTTELYISALEKDGLNLQYIKENIRTIIMIKKAIMNNGLALKFLSKEEHERLDENTYINAVCNKFDAINFVPEEKKTKSFKKQLGKMICSKYTYNQEYKIKQSRKKFIRTVDFTHNVNQNMYYMNI